MLKTILLFVIVYCSLRFVYDMAYRKGANDMCDLLEKRAKELIDASEDLVNDDEIG